ncbi:Panacea domain-containing protein [Roseibium album]|uniref:Panacea domain-containing protein n=1 Tax=Roseibium album TaxID=311410 RepID=UPI003BB033BA
MASSIDVAAAFARLSNEQLSNLELQKYVYLAHMMYAGTYDGENLVADEPFQAWDYGPVSPSLYRQLRGFGAANVPMIMLRSATPLDPEAMGVVERVWNTLHNATPGQLVAITHDQRGAWHSVYQPGVKGIQIPQSEILNEYRRRAA